MITLTLTMNQALRLGERLKKPNLLDDWLPELREIREQLKKEIIKEMQNGSI